MRKCCPARIDTDVLNAPIVAAVDETLMRHPMKFDITKRMHVVDTAIDRITNPLHKAILENYRRHAKYRRTSNEDRRCKLSLQTVRPYPEGAVIVVPAVAQPAWHTLRSGRGG